MRVRFGAVESPGFAPTRQCLGYPVRDDSLSHPHSAQAAFTQVHDFLPIPWGWRRRSSMRWDLCGCASSPAAGALVQAEPAREDEAVAARTAAMEVWIKPRPQPASGFPLVGSAFTKTRSQSGSAALLSLSTPAAA